MAAPTSSVAATRFKSAHGHAAWENPSLVVACPTCGSPAGHYCNRSGEPHDRPHAARREAAWDAAEPLPCPACSATGLADG